MTSETREGVTLRYTQGEWEASASTCVARAGSRHRALEELAVRLRRHAGQVALLAMRDGNKIYKLAEAAQTWAAREAP